MIGQIQILKLLLYCMCFIPQKLHESINTFYGDKHIYIDLYESVDDSKSELYYIYIIPLMY